MELKAYLRIVIAKAWMFLATFAITLGAVVTLTLGQTPVYESVTTYIVIPTLAEQDVRALASAISALGDDQIERTVAQVAQSRVVSSQAAAVLGLTGRQMAGVSVSSRLVPGTNVVEFAVQGPDPAVAQQVASVVGPLTTAVLEGPNWLYELMMLDQPTLPTSPTQPKLILNLLLGTVAGLALGAGMALFVAYLQKPVENKPPSEEAEVAQPAVPSSAGQPVDAHGVATRAALTASHGVSCSCTICSAGQRREESLSYLRPGGMTGRTLK